MNESIDRADKYDENESSVLRDTLSVINSLESEGIIGKYAIGGAMALLFYIEPIFTDDLDIFCHIPQSGLLVDLSSLYQHLENLGHKPDRECVSIEGIAVQFLVPNSPLVEEALQNAREITIEGVPTRVFHYEYLLAIMAQTGRPKDRAKIASALESLEPDIDKLKDILGRYNLSSTWSAMSA